MCKTRDQRSISDYKKRVAIYSPCCSGYLEVESVFVIILPGIFGLLCLLLKVIEVIILLCIII